MYFMLHSGGGYNQRFYKDEILRVRGEVLRVDGWMGEGEVSSIY
jgi:hypothetical protein